VGATAPRRVIAAVSPPASPTPAAAPATTQPAAPAASQGPAASDGGPGALPKPPGQTITTVSGERIKDSPAFTVEDLLQESPGVSFKQGNGPRDIGISIRGSNARNGFGVRNIVVLEDGFSVTQPDGLSRTDLIDPHAYGAVDVYRGPSSAMFGNYATGGAINFRLWRGDQINGARYGFESGSFGYVNNYALIGGRNEKAEGTIFMSDVRGDGYISHSGFNTQTFNALGTYSITPDDRVTFKAIENKLTANLSTRLSLNQFVANPFQRGCTNANAVSVALGCATVNLLANGFGGTTIQQTADEGAFGRHDWRNIGGLRWEHDFDQQTTWRTQAVFDDKNINQPTGATSAIGDSPSYNLLTHVTQRGNFFGFDAVHFMEVFYARERLTNYTWNVTPVAASGRCRPFMTAGTTSTGAAGFARKSVCHRIGWVTSRWDRIDHHRRSEHGLRLSRRRGGAGAFLGPAGFSQLRAGSRPALPVERGLAIPWPRLHRLRHADDQQPHGDGGGRERQQLAARLTDQCRSRCRRGLYAKPDREAQRDGFL
jgi:iron complex outermembrane receptor protein